MSIIDGDTIVANEVNTAHSFALAVTQDANVELPAVMWHTFQYRDLNASTPLWRRTTALVLPDDMFVEEVAAQAGDMAGTLTVTISSPSMIEAITLTGTVASPGISKLARYFADPTKPQQVLLKGSTVTVTVATTDAAGTQTAFVALGLVSYRRRS